MLLVLCASGLSKIVINVLELKMEKKALRWDLFLGLNNIMNNTLRVRLKI